MNSLIDANLTCLIQGIMLLESIPERIYPQPCEEVFGSSIGGHMRHNIDHYTAFLEGQEAGEIDYDVRKRDLALETDIRAAVQAMRQLIEKMSALSGADLDRPLRVRMDDGGDISWSSTSLRRELQFLLSHSIHHFALIVSIATRYGVKEFPDNFGVAPSTLHHQAGKGT